MSNLTPTQIVGTEALRLAKPNYFNSNEFAQFVIEHLGNEVHELALSNAVSIQERVREFIEPFKSSCAEQKKALEISKDKKKRRKRSPPKITYIKVSADDSDDAVIAALFDAICKSPGKTALDLNKYVGCGKRGYGLLGRMERRGQIPKPEVVTRGNNEYRLYFPPKALPGHEYQGERWSLRDLERHPANIHKLSHVTLRYRLIKLKMTVADAFVMERTDRAKNVEKSARLAA